MAYEELALADLRVNRANDRHGEVSSEDLAIAELFRLHDAQMRNLAADIASEGVIYDPPLVMPADNNYIVFDGNRRVTCAKLLSNPDQAPTAELREYFENLRNGRGEAISPHLTCRIEQDRSLVDSILYRRHTGSQGGVGQLPWNGRAKQNFVERTGRGNGVNLAAEVEQLLAEAGRLPQGDIPWSTLTRLLSSENLRNRAGISTRGRRFHLTHDRNEVVNALHRIASDLAGQIITLGDLWNNQAKRIYLDRLQNEGVLPLDSARLQSPAGAEGVSSAGSMAAAPIRNQSSSRQAQQGTFIPADVEQIQWPPNRQRVRAIWEELQVLTLRRYPNAISALMRILLELSVEAYIANNSLQANGTLSQKVGVVSRNLFDRGIIDRSYYEELERIRQNDQLISITSMQRYIHSPDFAPMEGEIRAYWMRLGRFLLATLNN